MNTLIFFCQNPTNSLQFVLDFIESQYKTLKFVIVSDTTEFRTSGFAKINYSNQRLSEEEIYIFNNQYLNDILEIPFPQKTYLENSCILFPNSTDQDDLGFDIFCSIFWMLNLYEERNNVRRDHHGRFLAEYSIFYSNKDFKTPIVDQWVELFISKINSKFQFKLIRSSSFFWSIGVDIDQTWKYLHKSSIKQIGGLVKSLFTLNTKEFNNRRKVLFGNKKDPFDAYEYLDHFGFLPEQLIFFILSKTEHNIDATHSFYQNEFKLILQHLKNKYTLGLHPSYYSIDDYSILKSEKSSLESTLKKTIKVSRQHFLRVKSPNTFRNLVSAGIEKDYSVCYPDFGGFKTGTCHPFHFFDLERNQQTALVIQPVQGMDRSFLQSMHLSSSETLEHIKLLLQECKNHEGMFHIIWHNSSFDYEAEWKSWENVFSGIVDLLKKETNE